MSPPAPQPLFEVPPLLIITGEAGHGKDTIADFIIGKYGYERLSFSDFLRQEVAAGYSRAPMPVTEAWLNLRDLKNVPQPRLAFTYCDDTEFVAIALRATLEEDRELFEKTVTSRHQPAALILEAATAGMWSDEERKLLPRSPRRVQQVWGTEYRREQDEDYWLKKALPFLGQGAPKCISSGRYPNEVAFAYAHGGTRWHVVRPGHKEVTIAHSSESGIAPIDARTIVLDNSGAPEQLYSKITALLSVPRARVAADAAPIGESRTRARLAL